MKRLVLILCAVLLFCAPAQALAMGGGSAGNGVVSQIGEVDKDIFVLEADEALTVELLPPAGPYMTADGKPCLLPLEWNVAAEELAQPGLHLVSGIPILPEGMTMAEGFDPAFTWPVFRKGDGAVLELATVTAGNISEMLIGLHDDPLDIWKPETMVDNSRSAEGWSLRTAGTEGFYWQWDLSAVDTANPGKYTITAVLCHPDWVSYPQECKTVSQTVYVMPKDRIELYAPVRLSNVGVLEFTWLYDSSNVTAATLEHKNEAGDWVSCEESWYRFVSGGTGAHDYLYLYLPDMPKEMPLTLRLRYQDVVDSVAMEQITAPITLTVPANIAELAEASNGRVVVDVIGGDRDGGDSDGDDMPDYQQPFPPVWGHPVWKPEADTELEPPVMEVVTDTFTTLSGLRVQQLVELGSTVLFEKQGISVEIPSQLLEELSLSADQRLEVTIEPQQNGVRIHVAVDGVPLETLGQTRVRMPWDSAEGTDLALLDANGQAIGSAVYEAAGTALFTISQPGTYCLQAVPTVEIPAGQEAPEAEIPPVVLPETPDSTERPAEQLPVENVPKPEEAEPQEPAADKVLPEPQQPAAEEQSTPFPWRLFIFIFPVAIIAILLVRRWRHG